MERVEINDVLVFDTETTGIPAKGLEWDKDFLKFPRVVQLAWHYKGELKSYIIKPEGWEIPDDTVEVHGISTERALKDGVPFEKAVTEFLFDANEARLICAHNIYFDVSILKADILRNMGREYYDAQADRALYKGKRIDTMTATRKYVGARFADGRPGKFPRLEDLYAKLFDGATFPAHDAGEDVKALTACLPPLVEMGIVKLMPKVYDAPKENEPATETKQGAVVFKDTEPVGIPDADPQPKQSNVANDLLNENDF